MSVESSSIHIFDKLKNAEEKGELKKQFAVLKNALVQRGIITISSLNKALEATCNKSLEELETPLTYIINPNNYAVDVLSGNKKTKSIQLPKPEKLPKFSDVSFRNTAEIDTSVFIVKKDAKTKKIIAENKLNKSFNSNITYGLTYNYKYPVLNMSDMHKILGKACVEKYLYSSIPENKTEAYPLDMVISIKGDFLAVSDSGAGNIYIIDSKTSNVTQNIKIREPGSLKRLHMTFSADSQKLFVTDNETENINIIDVPNGEKKQLKVKGGICGNLIFNNKLNTINLLLLDPNTKEIKVVNCNPESGEITKSIKIPGTAFSLETDPGDLITITNSGKYALVLSLTNEPVMFTPQINLIDLEIGKLVSKLTLQQNNKPANIAIFQSIKFPANTSLKDTLIARKVIDKKTLYKAFGIELEEDEAGAVYNYGSYDGSENDKGSEGEGVNGAASDIPQSNSNSGTSGQSNGPRKANEEFQKLNSAKVEKHIYKNCVDQFANKEKITLTEEEHPKACDRLSSACSKARNDLVYEENITVKITDILEGINLEVEISRAQISGAVHAETNKPKQQFKVMCEECGKEMPQDGGECPICHPKEPEEKEERKEKSWKDGLDLSGEQLTEEKKIEVKRAKKKKEILDKMMQEEKKKGPLSREAIKAKMMTGNSINTEDLEKLSFVVCARNQVMEVDRDKSVSFKYGGYGSTVAKKITNAFRAESTGERTILVVDNEAGEILEINKENKDSIKKWADNLNKPTSAIKLDNGNILVTSQNMIAEINSEGEKVWDFDKAESPNYAVKLENDHILFSDTKSAAVIEINQENEEIWKFDQVTSPDHLVKLDNGNLLIADNKENKIIEVNSDKEIVWEFSGKPKTGMRIMFNNPSYVKRLKNGNTVAVHSSQRKAIEIDKELNVIWQSSGANLGS